MYSRRCPSGSRKNTDTAGIHAITTGSSVGRPSKSSGVTPADLRICRSGDDIRRAHPKCDVHRHSLGTHARQPESEHRATSGADPEERSLTGRQDVRRLEADDVPVELDRAVHVSDRQMRFEEVLREDHRWVCRMRERAP